MSSEPPRRDFPETHWSQLLELSNPSHPRHAEHLGKLIQQYWKPAYHYARALRDLKTEDAEDLTQQFFTMLLTRVQFDRLSPDQGTFRGFLKTALRRFLISADRATAARAPKDGARLFQFGDAETHWRTAAERDVSPEEAFDREWARGVLTESMGRLEQELKAEGKALHFELFREYCLESAGPDEEGGDVSYEALARKHQVSLDDVRNGLRVVRQRGREILKEMLRDYLFPGENVEDELRFILSR